MFSDFGVRPAQRDRAKNSRSRKARRSRKMQTQPAVTESRSTPHGSAVASSAVSTHYGNEKAMETGKQWRQEESNGGEKTIETRKQWRKAMETRKQWRQQKNGDEKTMETRKQWRRESNETRKVPPKAVSLGKQITGLQLAKQMFLQSRLDGCLIWFTRQIVLEDTTL